ncbi:MAG TPA: multiheme c-type cytochrome [Anaerolineales bacterium]|nr:multiheme c-type cytochrome [Anaerolineales bacterium]
MKGTRLNRPASRFERARLWIVLGILILIAAAFLTSSRFDELKSNLDERESSFTLVTWLGVLTVTLILITFFYSLRKRMLQERASGTMMAWLQAHVYLGLLSLAVVFVHIWVPSFSEGWTSGKYALAAFALLVLSGVAWRIVYVVVPPKVAENVGNLSVSDTKDKSRVVKVEVDKLLAGKSAEFRRAAQNRLSDLPLEKNFSTVNLSIEEQYEWNRFTKMADRLHRYARREIQQGWYARFLQGWKLFHIPLSIVLIALVGYHIWETLHVSETLAGGELHGLPPASSCADCHADIVQEWKLAMHAHAQDAPVVIAQTNLALEKFPDFKRACNNCHAPIGTMLTGTPTLPIDLENELRSQTNGQVIDDGVTCIICHTIDDAPEERRGMFDDFPIVQGTLNEFARMFGPPLEGSPPLPSTRHASEVGFMTDSVASSQLCGACHNVKVDIDGDGEVTAFPGSDGNGRDSDGDNQLDENELEFDEEGKFLEDLVLQTTFDEWEDYVASQRAIGRDALGCLDCHMPALDPEPLVSSSPGSLLADAPERSRHSHSFIGVDYNLTPGFYEQEGMPPDAREHVLDERAQLLSSALNLSIDTTLNDSGKLVASVRVNSTLEGHNLPTGFAFARQMWLEVFAETRSGTQVCLADVDINGQIIGAHCASGQIESPQAELKSCNPLALAEIGLKASKNDELVQLDRRSIEPPSLCDPWLTNFQKILTDGDIDGDGLFKEVPYQSLLADIVKTRVRISDGQAMDALNNTILVNDEPRDTATYEYIFDLTGFEGETVTVTAIMHFRHLPPYFIRALDGGYPEGITADDLLDNMTVVDIDTVTSSPVQVP